MSSIEWYTARYGGLTKSERGFLLALLHNRTVRLDPSIAAELHDRGLIRKKHQGNAYVWELSQIGKEYAEKLT
jgi:hypothetical protein